MRQIIKIMQFDCESIPDVEANYTKCAKDKYFVKLGSCKNVWQIPLEKKLKEITAIQSLLVSYYVF